jgi:hypothetical protein
MFPACLLAVVFGATALLASPSHLGRDDANALAAPSPSSLTASDLKNHRAFVQKLSPSQQQALAKVYPDFKILKLCAGSYTGSKKQEFVMGIWKPVESRDSWKSAVHRVGLIWQRNAWVVHIIDDEIEKDTAISRSSPMDWAYELTNKGFVAGMKCNVNLAQDPQLNTKPFFSLRSKGLQNNKTVCFASSNVYNNWDCLVFSPRDNRFRLWMQQVYAD